MRYLSKFGRLIVQVRAGQYEAYANGIVRTISEPILAVFEPLGVTHDERKLAEEHFLFNGSYQEVDEATVVPPDHRIGVYDTEDAQRAQGWSLETRLEVEQFLRDLQHFSHIVEVPSTFLDPPWPKYDLFKGTPSALVRKLVDEGHDLSEVLTYERSNQNREPVIEAIERALLDPALTEEEVVG